MRHPTLILLVGFFSTTAFAESPQRWTGGRSVCDAQARQPIESAKATPVDHASLSQSLDYAIADADFLAGLKCFDDASGTAAGFAARLRELQAGVTPGLEATACSPVAAPDRLSRVRDSLARMRASEPLFAGALDKYESVSKNIAAQVPAGVAFDDCRARAQRGWASARLSLNKLSCEVSAAIENLDGYRQRAEMAGVACQGVPVAQARIQ